MQQRKALARVALLGLGLVPASALASAPAGVWVKVQEIVYTPNATSPTLVQVHGALMLHDGQSGLDRPYPGYTAPAFGYMYYECPAGQAETCRLEWSDLEANIAKPEDQCVGFGMNSLPTGTLRKPGSAVATPDAYPIQNGVSSGFSPCQVIGQFLASSQGGAGGAGGSADVPSSAGAGGTAPGGGVGGKPTTLGEAGADSGGETPTSGSGGSSSSGKGGTAASGRAGSGGGKLDPDKAAKDESESKASGCSVAAATGAASLLGLGAAVGLAGLALARRQRSRK